MKRFGDFLVNSPPALLLTGTALVLLVLYLIPGLHEIAWIVGLLSVLVIAAALLLWFLEWNRAQSRIDHLNARLAKARGAIGGVSLSSPVQDEPAPDTVRAERIRELFPTSSGLIQQLRVESGPVAANQLAGLRTFLTEFSHASFENPATHHAFMDLHRAGTALIAWFHTQTHDAGGLLEIVPGDTRAGGWREFAEVRDDGGHRIDTFVRARQAFERVALEHGVLR